MIPPRRRRRVFAGKKINRHPLFARGKGRGNVENPLSAEQLGMQGRQHFAPPPFSDRPGTQEGKQEGMKKQARSSMREGTKKQSSMREGMKKRSSMRDGTRKQSSMRKGMKKQSSMRGGMKKRSSMREGMKNAISPPFDVKGQDLARFLPLRCVEAKWKTLDIETAQTLHPEIFSPLDQLDISTCDVMLRNPRRRSNQFLVEDGKLPVDWAGGDDR